MITYIAEKLTHWLKQYVSMTDSEFEVYQYAFDIALYTFLSTLGLVCIGIALGALVPTILCIALFYINQTFGGGYHANSHMGCFMTMAIGLLLYLLLLSLKPEPQICYIVTILSFCILMIKPLVLHKNKYYLEDKRKEFAVRSQIIVLAELIAYGLLINTRNTQLLASASFSLLLCAVSRIAAWLLAKKRP